MQYESLFSDTYWENCTHEENVATKIRGIQKRLSEYSLEHLVEKFQDRTLKIFEVGSGNGEFLKALQNHGFHNIRGLDMNPRHMRKYPELDELIDIDIIQMRHKPKNEELYDLVYSNFVFDEDCYREQRNQGMRDAMLTNIHGMLIGNGLYFGNEMHQKSEIISTIKAITPRANSLIGGIEREFIPAKK